MASIIKMKNLSPFYLVHPNCLTELPPLKDQNFTSVVLGDAAGDFSYENLNKVLTFKGFWVNLIKKVGIHLGIPDSDQVKWPFIHSWKRKVLSWRWRTYIRCRSICHSSGICLWFKSSYCWKTRPWLFQGSSQRYGYPGRKCSHGMTNFSGFKKFLQLKWLIWIQVGDDIVSDVGGAQKCDIQGSTK